MSRQVVELKYKVGARTVTVKAMDQVGPEDAYEVIMTGVLHRYVTGEDVVPTVTRDVKDSMLKLNLFI
jgi:hypothetical protein